MNPLARLLGESAGIVAVREQLAHLLEHHLGGARRLPPILIQGETGTGKGLVAAAVHRAGPRASGPFVDVNCAAIPENLLEAELFGFERGAFTDARRAKAGLLQTATRGVIFLDEIGLMPEALQAKLLKAIEERAVRRLGATRSEPVDVWVVAATSENLAEAVRARRFREDLYHRLAVVTLTLPPLRERGEDVLRLADHFLKRACEEYGLPQKALTGDARAALLAYPWPGNVREVANVMERVALLCEEDAVSSAELDLPAPPAPPASYGAAAANAAEERRAAGEAAAAAERARLAEALRATAWNISRAAERLGMPRNTLRYRLEKHGLLPSGGGAAAAERADPPPDTRAAEVAPEDAAPVAAARPERWSRTVRWEPRGVALLRVRLGSAREEAGSPEAGRAMEVVLEKVRSFGGSAVELSPSGVLAAFGVTPSEDAARRAAHTATVVRNLLARGRGEEVASPAIRLAVHTAQVLVGRFGDAAEIDADARREAGRLLDALIERADAGEVRVSAAAAAHLGRRFDLVAVDAGDGAPGPAYRLTGYTGAHRRLTRFVGREAELRLLEERFAQAESGHGQIVSLVGEPGIGKTRLLHELRRRVADRATWIEGQAVSFGRSVPLHAPIDLLRRTLGSEEGDREAVIVEKIEERVERLGGAVERPDFEARPAVPFLRYLLSVDPGDPRVLAMDPKLRRAEVFDALCRLLVGEATLAPLVVVLEDVHWVDHATEEWLALMGDRLETRRILLVLTHRPGYAPPLGDRTFHTRLPIGALAAAESIEMTRALLEARELPEALEGLITRKAEGIPFFVEEVVRSLVEAGAIGREGDRLVLARRVDEIVIPDTVEDLLRARLDRLGDGPRWTLQVASVIGREFGRRLLDRLTGLGDESEAHLRDLRALELVSEKSRSPELVYAFRHALTREAAYRSLADDRRKALHRSAGLAIEEAFADRLVEHYETLAHHFSRGEAWPRALDYLLKAADKAAQAFAIQQALALYDDALAVAERRPEVMDRATAIAIHRARSGLYFLVSDFGRSRAEAETVLALAREAGDRGEEAEALAAIAWAATWARDLPGAVAYAHRAIEVATPGGNAKVLGRAHLTVGFVRGVTGGLDEAREHTGRALAASEAAGDRTHHSLALSVAGLVRSWEGDFHLAAQAQARGLAIAREDHLRVPLLFSFFLYGLTLTGKGDYDEALALFEEGLGLAEKLGDEAIHHRLLNCLGWLHMELGDLDHAIVLNERSAEVGRRRRDPGTLPNAQLNLGDILMARGDLEQARDRFDEVHGLARDGGQSDWMKWRYTIRLHASRGEWWLARGRLAEALACADQCRELASRTRSRKNLVKGWRLAGEIARARRRWDEAETCFREALAIADLVRNPTQTWRTHLALGRCREEAGRIDAARQSYRAARDVVERVRSGLRDERLRGAFERAAAVREALDLGAAP